MVNGHSAEAGMPLNNMKFFIKSPQNQFSLILPLPQALETEAAQIFTFYDSK